MLAAILGGGSVLFLILSIGHLTTTGVPLPPPWSSALALHDEGGPATQHAGTIAANGALHPQF